MEHPGVVWLARWLEPRADHLRARWLFLRALGLCFFAAFGALAAQAHALVGPTGVLPARNYLETIARARPGLSRLWFAPSVLWLDASDAAITALVVLGLAGSLLLFANVAPRAAALACSALFLSFVSVARDFSFYQSDGMLLEAGVFGALLAPSGLRPLLGAHAPPSRVAHALLLWEWFRVYFESGLAKLASGEPEWRALTAMDRYYETGPLPTWLAWWAHQLPHGVHAATVVFMFVVELPVVVLALAWRRARPACFALATALQLGIIVTANYAFLNYLVLALGLLLLDDDVLARLPLHRVGDGPRRPPRPRWRALAHAAFGAWILYATVAEVAMLGAPKEASWLGAPARALEPFRLANRYQLFAVMTRGRWQLEIQGSRDGETWIAWPARYAPGDPKRAPKVFAPYQPRFEWNLWFCSLGAWDECPLAFEAAGRLLQREPHITALFESDPFAGGPPAKYARVVRWEYRFTDRETRAATGDWWTRRSLGVWGMTLVREDDGTVTGVLPEESITPE